MSEDAIRAHVFGVIQAEFPARVSGVDIVPENSKYNQSMTPWIYLQIAPTISGRKEISSSRLTAHEGVLSVLCMVPPDSGTKKMWEMAGAVYDILSDRTWSLPGAEGRLTTYGAEKRNRGLINGFHTATVMVDYRLNKLQVRP